MLCTVNSSVGYSSVKKETSFWVGHFTTISGHFMANYISIFLKTEFETVILGCCLNLNWIKKLRHKSQFFLTTVFFIFVRKKPGNLSSKNGHFSTICGQFFGNYINIYHRTEIQTVILRWLVCLNLNWKQEKK